MEFSVKPGFKAKRESPHPVPSILCWHFAFVPVALAQSRRNLLK